MFSGSYVLDDVTFLLKVIDMPAIDIAAKEHLIQSGKRHYSDIISPEEPPTPEYLDLFHAACARNNARFAEHLALLAIHIAKKVEGQIILVSLARAGTPVGVLLRRILVHKLGCTARHYSISIIRDRGIDTAALEHILADASDRDVVFVDGWTGKGVIAHELDIAVRAFNLRHGTGLPHGLHVVSDLCGRAEVAPTSYDYLIPCSVLNSVVSGLISRSILNCDYIKEGDFHGCLYYSNLGKVDLSCRFVDDVMRAVDELPAALWNSSSPMLSEDEKQRLQESSKCFTQGIMKEFRIRSINHVKPGIAESTRALLRRVPSRLLLKNADDVDVQHLIQLAESKSVPWEERPDLPFAATALISELIR